MRSPPRLLSSPLRATATVPEVYWYGTSAKPFGRATASSHITPALALFARCWTVRPLYCSTPCICGFRASRTCIETASLKLYVG